MSDADKRMEIAHALEALVTKAIQDFDFGMDVLKLPDHVREPMWNAICRRAAQKAVECGAHSPSRARSRA